MDVGRGTLLAFIAIGGGLILVSYVAGVARATRASDLWGGVTPAMQAVIVPIMFLAAAGFLLSFSLLLFKSPPAVVAGLHWPWAAADGQGGKRLLVGLALLIIPSAFWLEATLLHLRSPQPWTPALVVGVLALVALGNLLLIALFYGAYRDGIPRAGWMLAGVLVLGVQTILNDFVIWNLRFPW